MKRPNSDLADPGNKVTSEPPKRRRPSNSDQVDQVMLDENLLYEVLKHVDDARSLASAACVSRQWRSTAQDERLWELICTKNAAGRHQQQQLRLVVTALGGFRQLFSQYLWPLLKPSSSSSSSSSAAPAAAELSSLPPPPAPARSATGKKRWGKDEVNLSLSLLSISYYGKMNFNKLKRK